VENTQATGCIPRFFIIRRRCSTQLFPYSSLVVYQILRLKKITSFDKALDNKILDYIGRKKSVVEEHEILVKDRKKNAAEKSLLSLLPGNCIADCPRFRFNRPAVFPGDSAS